MIHWCLTCRLGVGRRCAPQADNCQEGRQGWRETCPRRARLQPGFPGHGVGFRRQGVRYRPPPPPPPKLTPNPSPLSSSRGGPGLLRHLTPVFFFVFFSPATGAASPAAGVDVEAPAEAEARGTWTRT